MGKTQKKKLAHFDINVVNDSDYKAIDPYVAILFPKSWVDKKGDWVKGEYFSSEMSVNVKMEPGSYPSEPTDEDLARSLMRECFKEIESIRAHGSGTFTIALAF